MAEYSVEAIGKLVEAFAQAGVHRPMRPDRYDPGAELTYDITGLVPSRPATARVVIEKFVGGGFAGQVYRVKLVEIDCPGGDIHGLSVGGIYAIKILIPPSSRSRAFRDLLYKIGFQAPFSLQGNPDAARAGALWQKFIRRASAIRFGDDQAVVDVHATFIDHVLGSCGEISQWIDGRTWRFEVDDRLLARWRWSPGKSDHGLGSPEYRAKRSFMAGFVELLHELGAPELARQYEWWTCKSQPNALKRLDSGDVADTGLTAVDFRAGLTLLPFGPMSPGDFKLIASGLLRGSLVQFDRGDTDRLWGFMNLHREQFTDMWEAFEELNEAETRYRNSQIDITHNHVRLLYDRQLHSGIVEGMVRSWRTRNVIDQATGESLNSSRLRTTSFAALGLLKPVAWVWAIVHVVAVVASGGSFWPALAIAAVVVAAGSLIGKFARRVWGRADYRAHYASMLTSLSYLRRALAARRAEAAGRWHRDGRIGEDQAESVAARPALFVMHWILSILPGAMHRMLTDRRYAAEKLRYVFVRPVRLYFNHEAREQWLRDMVFQGRRRHMLTEEDAEVILSRLDEPFIQKYLKSLAVHVCTLPVTQIVSVAVAVWYVQTHELSAAEAWAAALGILAAFQIVPISPGSLVRGLYVLYLVLRERNFKDYNIAVFLGFFKYVGYLAFPIQMTYKYPALARFMAAHWATGAVRVLPVFGEHGALLEHFVFDLFYNYPLTVRRKMRLRASARKRLRPRAWHGALLVVAATVAMGAAAYLCRAKWAVLPTLSQVWAAVLVVPALVGALATIWAGGKVFARRINLAILCGFATGVGYGFAYAAINFLAGLGGGGQGCLSLRETIQNGMWGTFFFTIVAGVVALLTEINLPESADADRLDGLQQPEAQNDLAGEIGVDSGGEIVEKDSPTGG